MIESQRRPYALILLCLAALTGLGPSAHADRVITADGRVLKPSKAREQGEGYVFSFEHGEIVLPDRDGIQAIEIEGDMSDYVPKNDDEREKLEKGYVRYRGKWMSKPAYEGELSKEFEASKKRLDLLAVHSKWMNAWTLETKHFVFKSNTSSEILQDYADLLEAFYKLMDKRIGIKPTPRYRKIKMEVNIYKSHEQFLKQNGKENPSLLGFFDPNNDSLNFFHDYADPKRSQWIALHECTHLLTFLIDQQYRSQIWLNEAVADYFGSAEAARGKRGKFHIEPGKLQTDRILTVQQAIEDGKDIKLADLFFIDRKDFTGFEYAHAWSFVYFLNNWKDGKYQKAFNKFFKGLYTLEKGLSFETEPGPPPSGVYKFVPPDEIRDYLFKKIKIDDVDLLEDAWKAFVSEIAIEGPKARLKRGTRALGRLDFENALTDLDAAIEGGVEDPRAWASRGLARAFKGDLPGAREDMQAAVERAPLSAEFRYRLANILVGRASIGPSSGKAASEDDKEAYDSPEAKREAGLATELDPENARYREFFQRFD